MQEKSDGYTGCLLVQLFQKTLLHICSFEDMHKGYATVSQIMKELDGRFASISQNWFGAKF